MLNLSSTNSQSTPRILLPNHKPFIPVVGRNAFFADTPKFKSVRNYRNIRARRGSVGTTKAIFKTSNDQKTSTTTTAVKAVITVQQTLFGCLSDIWLSGGQDLIADIRGRTLSVELVSTELDPETGKEKPRVQAYAHFKGIHGYEIQYESDLNVPYYFGKVGAIIVENEHHKEMFVKNIIVNGLNDSSFTVSCNSWIHSKVDDKEPRIFFIDKSYLPSNTPSGLKRYREKELQSLRSDGTGLRKPYERIYDYDVYNDLGDPDESEDLYRVVLGGKEHPYPRRCRTGRERTQSDPFSESRSDSVYVPRDEAFSEVKAFTFMGKALYSGLRSRVAQIESSVLHREHGFPNFTAIETLFNQGVKLPPLKAAGSLIDRLSKIVRTITFVENRILRFEKPEVFDRDRFSWFRDEEFVRQTLAGVNPCCIELVTEWPLKSKLDPEEYGPAESAITDEVVEKQVGSLTTIEEAVKQKKLFILDYHDVFLPYVNKVRKLQGTTFYGSRTLFYLMPSGTLRPLAIELTRPPMDGKPQWKEVYTPTWDATNLWLWRLAKAHVLAHDSGYHQLVTHWLNTHCSMEPYIIATNRQLSAMHPIYRLLHPHMRYTMEINASARQNLINAGGVIEKSFSPLKYSIEISSVAYDKLWQFNLQALPANLIHRGMAVEDPTAPHGLKLTIEDYPYANDALLIWDAIKKWVTDYVIYFYPEENLVRSDNELQAWWTEIKTVGHADKKDEPWWPVIETTNDLIEIITTIIWVASGQHAAVNFGQYDFSGYFPNRPTIARTNMPTEDPDDTEKEEFLKRPEAFLLKCFPSQVQATSVMATLDVLSTHSPDEEYIGGEIPPYWKEDKHISALFELFTGRLKMIEGIIDDRNEQKTLKNRHGAGLVPYKLLRPFSEPGVTGMGVPNSVSI